MFKLLIICSLAQLALSFWQIPNPFDMIAPGFGDGVCDSKDLQKEQACWNKATAPDAKALNTIITRMTKYIPQCSPIYEASCAPKGLLADQCLNQFELEVANNNTLSNQEKRKIITVLNKCLPSFSVDFYRTLQESMQISLPFGHKQTQDAQSETTGEKQHPCSLTQPQVACLSRVTRFDLEYTMAGLTLYTEKNHCLKSIPSQCRFEVQNADACKNEDLQTIVKQYAMRLEVCVDAANQKQ